MAAIKRAMLDKSCTQVNHKLLVLFTWFNRRSIDCPHTGRNLLPHPTSHSIVSKLKFDFYVLFTKINPIKSEP